MQNEVTNFSYGSDKQDQMLKSFGEDPLEKGSKGGKLDTSHLVLKDVLVDGKTEKRWVDPNKNNQEHAPRGSAVSFQHKGETKHGVAGRVAPNGQYEVHTDDGSVYKHHHQMDVKEKGTPDVTDHAKNVSDEGLKNALNDKEADPKLKEAAQKELDARTKPKKETGEKQPKQEEQPKKSVFSRVKGKKELAAKGIDMNDPEIKEMYDAAKDMSSKDLEDIQENEKLTDKESSVIEHILREKNFVEPVERMENYEHAIKQLIAAPRANLFVYGKGGTGKSQRLTDNVLTPSGWKKMGELKINDEILTPSGRVSKVVGIFPQGIIDIYKLTLSDTSVAYASGEHLWKVWNKIKRPGKGIWGCDEIVSTLDIINSGIRTQKNKQGYRFHIPYLPVPVNFTKSKMPIDGWLLGFLLGDGCLSENHVKFAVGERDKEFILNKISTLIPDVCRIRHDGGCNYSIMFAERNTNNKKGTSLKHQLHLELLKLNVCVGSKEKFIPEIYLTASLEERLKLIQGLMDSDGYVELDGQCSFGSSSEKLTRGFRQLAKSFGKYANFKICKAKKATGLVARYENYKPIPGYSCRFFLPSEFLPVTIPFKLERYLKSNRIKNIKEGKNFNGRGLSIINIELYGKEEAQCIMIDDIEHLYITDDFITTHNTYNVRKLLKEKYGDDAEYDPTKDTYSDDTYKYVFPDRVTPSALYELLYAHNGKTIVFDDADGILKDPDVINMLKKAMDTSDSRLGKDTKGGKPILLNDKATGEDIEVPSSYKFTGKIIFISNKPKEFFTADEDRRALLSRGKSMELQFTNTETKDLIKDKILDGIKKNADWKTLGDTIPKDKGGKPDMSSPEYKEFTKDVDTVFKFIEDHVDEIPEGKLNGRMIENLYQSYKYANQYNEKAPEKKKLNVDKYLGDQLLKSVDNGMDILQKAFVDIGVFDYVEDVKIKERSDIEKALQNLLNENFEKGGKGSGRKRIFVHKDSKKKIHLNTINNKEHHIINSDDENYEKGDELNSIQWLKNDGYVEHKKELSNKLYDLSTYKPIKK